MQFVWFLLVGLVAGWLAGVLVKGRGFGVVGDIVFGVIGSMIGGALFQSSGRGLIGSVAVATVGAVLLILVVRVLKRA
jgi:uncharacterized membrane protein YeaQ/YmgE (transglycosylase-associated protein family)